MNNICPACGGECVPTGKGAGYTVYRCTCCDNEYRVSEGQPFPVYHTARRAAQTAETAESVPSAREEPRELNGEQIYSRCINSVLEVRARRGNKIFSGSACVLNGGYAVTNAHVVAEDGRRADRIELYGCGSKFFGVIVALGSDFEGGEDLALLKFSGAPSAVAPVRFADVSLIKNGQPLYVIGNSLGGGTCITAGIVSDRRRMLDGKPRLMTDCAVNRGNSGGPVFNAWGEVAGTIVAVTTAAEGMNYAIPADIVIKFINRCGIDA